MPDQFEVGQRVYWPDFYSLDLYWGDFGQHVVASGVVVSAGPAVSTIWADEGSGSPCMVTKANDKVTGDRANVEAKIAPMNEKLDETRRSILEQKMDQLEAAAEGVAAVVSEPLPRRRGWGRR